MPIDNRKVLQNIRVSETLDSSGKVTGERRVLTEEHADDISAMFSQKQLDAFVENGVLAGDWKSAAKPTKPEAEKK